MDKARNRSHLIRVAYEAIISNSVEYDYSTDKWACRKKFIELIYQKDYDTFFSIVEDLIYKISNKFLKEYIVTSLNYVPGYKILKTFGLYRIDGTCNDVNPSIAIRLHYIQMYNYIKSVGGNAIINCHYSPNIIHGDIVIIEKMEE